MTKILAIKETVIIISCPSLRSSFEEIDLFLVVYIKGKIDDYDAKSGKQQRILVTKKKVFLE